MDRNFIYAIQNIHTEPKKVFKELNNKRFFTEVHRDTCKGGFKPVVRPKELVRDAIYNIECIHYYNGQLIMVLDNASIPIKEKEFCCPPLTEFSDSFFVKFNGEKIISVDPLYIQPKKRHCFCVEEYECKGECLCQSNQQTEPNSICECLSE